VKAAGNSTSVQNYHTFDYSPAYGKINYYRLKQTDINGTSTFSDQWIPVRIGMSEVFNINYIKQTDKLEVMFEYDAEGTVDLTVTDVSGRVMYQQTGFGATPGLNILPIQAKGWTEGVYLITLHDSTRQVTHKIFY
jgi:hypothetical protein